MLKPRPQTGAALIAFVAMLMLLMASISAAITLFLMMGRQLANQQLDREIAFRAAEAALLDGESDLVAAAHGDDDRFAVWPAPGGCGEGAQAGLCRTSGRDAAWQAWLDGSSASIASRNLGVALGTFTGAQLPPLPPDVIGATTLPRYLIELRDDAPSPTRDAWPVFRIVALGVGRDPSVRVVLQTEFQP